MGPTRQRRVCLFWLHGRPVLSRQPTWCRGCIEPSDLASHDVTASTACPVVLTDYQGARQMVKRRGEGIRPEGIRAEAVEP